MGAMAMIRASQHLLAATPAQVPCDPTKDLHSKQCKNTQQGEEILFGGRTTHETLDFIESGVIQAKSRFNLTA
jgi:hypothetical protein